MKFIPCIAVLLIFWLPISAQERKLSIKADKDEIKIGEQFQLMWTLTTNATDTVQPPVLNDKVFDKFEFLEKGKIDTAYDSIDISQRILSQKYILTSFDSGYYPIPPLEALVNNATVSSDPMLISVRTVAVDTAQPIKDIRNVAEMPFSVTDWLREYWEWPTGIVLLAIIILAFIYFLKRKKKPAPKPEPPKIEIPPHIWALEELQKLEEKKLWQNGNFKGYYSELTDILRGYIEYRFYIHALEQTSEEILVGIRHEPEIGKEHQGRIRKLLSLADLVKFAKEKPLPAENEQSFETVKRFVLATEITEKEVEEKTAPDKQEGNG